MSEAKKWWHEFTKEEAEKHGKAIGEFFQHDDRIKRFESALDVAREALEIAEKTADACGAMCGSCQDGIVNSAREALAKIEELTDLPNRQDADNDACVIKEQ